MDKPVFSIATASRRNQYYDWFYESLTKDTSVPFEIVFVGPNPPLHKMPDNFRHIYSTASPCQCIEIAVRKARGEYVLSIGDDVQFSEKFLDKLYSYTQRFDKDKVLISFRLFLSDKKKPGDVGFEFDSVVPILPGEMPLLGMGPAFRRDLWIKLGGLDKRFHSSYCDVDMTFRFYEYGMRMFLPQDCFIIEVQKKTGLFKEKGWNKLGHPNCSLTRTYHATAQKLLESLWVKDGWSKTRLSPVESFTEEELKI